MQDMQANPLDINATRAATDKVARIYLAIKDALLSHRLPPSTFLNIKSLARTLKVSPTPVREALIRLANEDIIRQVPAGRGYFSRAFRIDEIVGEYEAALLIASHALQKNRDHPATGDLLPPAAHVRQCAPDPVQARIVVIERFYARAAKLSGNPALLRHMQQFIERTRFVRAFDLRIPGRLEEVDLALARLQSSLVAGGEPDGAIDILRDLTEDKVKRLPDLLQHILRLALAEDLSIETVLAGKA